MGSEMKPTYRRILISRMKFIGDIVLTTPIMFWAGRRFFRGFWSALRHGTADMNTLVAVGTGSAYLYSATVTLFPGLVPQAHHGVGHAAVYFDTTAMIVTGITTAAAAEGA